MKKYSLPLFIFLLVFAFILHPQSAYAHFPATDGDMTVTLHVDPDDDPIPGQKAIINFLFDDSTNRFQIEQCQCSLTIAEQGFTLYSNTHLASKDATNSIWNASLPYIFPKRDVYEIILSGKPKGKIDFQSFTVHWFFRVDQFPQGQVLGTSDNSFIYFVIAYFSIFLVTGAAVYAIIRF